MNIWPSVGRTFFVGGPRAGLVLLGIPELERLTVSADGSLVLHDMTADSGDAYVCVLRADRWMEWDEVGAQGEHPENWVTLAMGDAVYEWRALEGHGRG